MYQRHLQEKVFYGTFFMSAVSVINYEYLILCSGISPKIPEETNILWEECVCGSFNGCTKEMGCK